MSLIKKIQELFGGKDDAPATGAPLAVYMDPIEYSQLRAIVETLQPRTILEWGCGGSTCAFLEEFPYLERLVSIEHNRMWFERVRNLVDDPRLELYCDPPAVEEPDMNGDKEAYKRWMALCEDDPSVMADYVARAVSLGQRFDFVFVDGRARIHCLKTGFDLLNPGGVILVHDAQRPAYHETLRSLGRPVFLEPFVNGQMCFVRKPGRLV